MDRSSDNVIEKKLFSCIRSIVILAEFMNLKRVPCLLLRGDLPALLLLLHKLFMAYTLNNTFVGVLCASLFEKQKKRNCHENVVIFSAPHFMDLSEMRVWKRFRLVWWWNGGLGRPSNGCRAFSPDGIKTRALAIDSFTFPLTLKCLVQFS